MNVNTLTQQQIYIYDIQLLHKKGWGPSFSNNGPHPFLS